MSIAIEKTMEDGQRRFVMERTAVVARTKPSAPAWPIMVIVLGGVLTISWAAFIIWGLLSLVGALM